MPPGLVTPKSALHATAMGFADDGRRAALRQPRLGLGDDSSRGGVTGAVAIGATMASLRG